MRPGLGMRGGPPIHFVVVVRADAGFGDDVSMRVRPEVFGGAPSGTSFTKSKGINS